MPYPLSAPSRPVRIVIADDHPIFRDGLQRLLETDAALQIVGETAVGPDVVRLVREQSPDILLLGPSAAAPAAATLRQLTEAGVVVRTILLVRSIDMPEIADALQFGACGVLTKESAAEVLFESIETVMSGAYWVGHERAANLLVSARRFAAEQRQTHKFGLTAREQDIVRAVIDGDTNKEIGRRLAISENTVKRHLLHIFNKVGASSRIELALFAAHHRLLDSI
jgi:two-component system, NarL family, nitrate/nitrite response regulator NarL